MSSFSVIYEGQRCVVKAAPGPSTRLLSLLQEAAAQFGLDASLCQLRHKQRALDLSLPVRLAGLPQNATLDLVRASNSALVNAQRAAPVRLSLSVNASLSLTHTFAADTSLQAVLRHFVAEGLLPAEIDADAEREVELVYMRAVFASRRERETETLRSLGLAGQSVRFLLRFDPALALASSAPVTVSSVSTPTYTQTPMEVETERETERESEKENEKETEKDTVSENDGERKIVPQPLSSVPVSVSVSAESAPLSEQRSLCDAVAERERERKRERDELSCENNNNINISPSDTPAHTEHSAESIPTHTTETLTPHEAIARFLSSNFDAASKPAVITMHKYLSNILSNPAFSKFRSVNMKNKVFLEKLSEPSVKGALAFFFSVGFVLNTESQTLVLPDDSEREGERNRLFAGIAALEWAFDELSLSEDERPRPPQTVSDAQREREPPVEFDPFKTFLVRTAQQPPREVSATEKQLNALQQRRLELEGSIDAVERETEVVLPSSSSSHSSSSHSSSSVGPTQGGVEEDVPSSTSLSPALLQKILNTKGDAETPLTTQALRDLQRAQKERVFQKTLVRVRFADRSQLCGYFHVRETVADLYLWVYRSLRGTESGDNADGVRESEEHKRENVLSACALFELSFSPPRTVLRAYPSLPNNRSLRNVNEDAWVSPSLVDAQLVPAALLTLSWKSSSPALSIASNFVGAHFRESLLLCATEQSTRKTIPAGVPLVEKSTASQKAPLADQSRTEETTSTKKKESAGKFKWFKL